MPLVREFTSPTVTITVNQKKCRGCGLCAKVCFGNPLTMRGKTVEVDLDRGFGCIECGHCVTVCPTGAIRVKGRELQPEDLARMPAKKDLPPFVKFKNLLDARRSVRVFKDRPVSRAHAAKILDAASCAPMGIPPSPVEVLVLQGKDRVKEFRDDLLAAMLAKRGFISNSWVQFFLRPFLGAEQVELLRDFVVPVMNTYEDKDRVGVDWFLYEAPLCMYFHAKPHADPADPIIAATYAMLGAQALGLGACMIGMVGPFFKRDKKLLAKYGVEPRHMAGLAVIFGHPAVKYQKTVKRRLGGVKYWEGKKEGATSS